MTIDERLEALTARHEAIAQSVELLTHDIHEMQAAGKQTSRDIELLLATAKARRREYPRVGAYCRCQGHFGNFSSAGSV
jgi:hypothetical protein